jgi:biotin transport system substrate-specific component
MKKTLNSKGMILCALFAALTASGALIAIPIPFSPIPISLQALFVFLSGAILGSNLGALSQLVYLLLGILGLPVFARGASGIGVVIGPTGGYLAGFVIAAYIIGFIFERKIKSTVTIDALVMFLGMAIYYITGTIWLMRVMDLGVVKAITAGILPFLPGDILKVIIAAIIVNKNAIKHAFIP